MYSNPDFLTMGDTNYFETMKFSVKQVQEYHPKSRFFIYDLGLDSEEVDELSQFGNVRMIQGFTPDIEFNFIEDLQYQVGSSLERYGDLMTQNQTVIETIINRLKKFAGYKKFRDRFNIFMENKIQCLLDVTARADGTFVFVDADVVIVDPVDVYKKHDFDIGVTLRSNTTISSDIFRVLNSGVIFFNTDKERCDTFINNWESKMKEIDEEIPEQTALTKLIWESDSDIYSDYYNKSTGTLNGFEFDYQVFPCERYNYTSVEEGINKDENKIIHFKSDRYEAFDIEKVILSVEENGEYIPDN
jgi:hypothetical protein